MIDRPVAVSEPKPDFCTLILNLEPSVTPGHKQSMIDRIVHQGLDGGLDPPEIQNHALFIQGPFQFNIQEPGIAHKAPLAVQAGEIHGTKLFYE